MDDEEFWEKLGVTEDSPYAKTGAELNKISNPFLNSWQDLEAEVQALRDLINYMNETEGYDRQCLNYSVEHNVVCWLDEDHTGQHERDRRPNNEGYVWE